MKLILVKYSVLLAALCVCVYVLLIRNSFTWPMLYLVLGLSLFYILIAVAGNLSQTQKTSKKANSFVYYTPGLLTKKAIRIGGYAIAAGILLFSGIKVLLFGILLLAMLLSELAGLWISLKNDLYFLYFDGKALVFQQDQVSRIFATHIREIEYRYEIFYLTLSNNQVKMVETQKVKESSRADFIKEFVNWALTNDIPFTEEAKGKLKI
ncbi:MAG: hypothetical protein K0S33_540 [Bacteroidetes bacterium]|nr:hypothetical protein [Bacteroidota bacterium]